MVITTELFDDDRTGGQRCEARLDSLFLVVIRASAGLLDGWITLQLASDPHHGVIADDSAGLLELGEGGLHFALGQTGIAHELLEVVDVDSGERGARAGAQGELEELGARREPLKRWL